MTNRRFPPPWTIERLPGGFKVVDAHGQSLAYFYARENDNDAGTAGVLTMDEARRLASNFAKLPELLGAVGQTGKGAGDKLGRGGLAKKPPTGGRDQERASPLEKETFYTKVGDQICGVGYYKE